MQIVILLLLFATTAPFVNVNESVQLLDAEVGPEESSGNSTLAAVSKSQPQGVNIDSYYYHTCLSSPERPTVTCWGRNANGEHGTGFSQPYNTPVNSLNLGGQGVIDVAVGSTQQNGGYTCAINDLFELYCWGGNQNGNLGIGSLTDSSSPTRVNLGMSLGAKKVSTGYATSCAVITDGTVKCWGWATDGRAGQGSWGGNIVYPEATGSFGSNKSAIDVSTGYYNSCALLDDGSVSCWGYGAHGVNGNGGTTTKVTPETVLGFGPTNPAKQISVGYRHACALTLNGSVYCWGENVNYALGSTGGGANSPRLVQALADENVVHVGAGIHNTCAVTVEGVAYCWGWNSNGQLGDGTTTNSLTPVQIDSLGANRKAISVSMGYASFCFLLDDSSVNCIGSNSVGQLGTGDTISRYSPQVYSNRTLSAPILASIIEGQTYELSLDGEVFETMDLSTVSIILERPNGMNFNNTTMHLSGAPAYSTQTQWAITVADANQSETGYYHLRILPDTDLDSIPNVDDLDDDNDGVPDELDACPTLVGNSTIDVVGCVDSDGDGVSNNGDAFPNDKTQHTDTDQDGYGDNTTGTLPDGCPAVYGLSLRGGLFGCLDGDGDGWADSIDAYPAEISQWNDTDGDGYGDSIIGFEGDACPTNYGNSYRDRYGCIDSDSDGWSDDGDAFPDDATQHADQDNDGYGDNQSAGATLVDVFPTDATQWIDMDGDGYGDNPSGNQGDVFPNDPYEWFDTDSDGVGNNADAFPFDPSQTNDSDGDGFGDNQRGTGADKFPDDETQWSDIDGDGYGDNSEGTTPDAFIADPTQWSDIDGDGYGDNPTGRQADAFPNDPTQWLDQDGDGYGDNQSGNNPDPFLFDFDNDGYNDSIDPLPKLASPGDLDNDGVPDEEDLFPEDYREWADADGDGEGDNADTDDDNDGWPDADELRQGTDPFSSSSQPVDSFEVVIPGTAIGLGAWDLIGMFGGIPLAFWILFGFVTRNQRTAKYETMLRESNSRDELEDVARQWEYSLMLRLLGPHQGIRLERLRAELDDRFESQNQRLSSIDEEYIDHTHLVEDELVDESKQPPSLFQDELEAAAEAPPDKDTPAQETDESGYEWVTDQNGIAYYRPTGSGVPWVKFEN